MSNQHNQVIICSHTLTVSLPHWMRNVPNLDSFQHFISNRCCSLIIMVLHIRVVLLDSHVYFYVSSAPAKIFYAIVLDRLSRSALWSYAYNILPFSFLVFSVLTAIRAYMSLKENISTCRLSAMNAFLLLAYCGLLSLFFVAIRVHIVKLRAIVITMHHS